MHLTFSTASVYWEWGRGWTSLIHLRHMVRNICSSDALKNCFNTINKQIVKKSMYTFFFYLLIFFHLQLIKVLLQKQKV